MIDAVEEGGGAEGEAALANPEKLKTWILHLKSM